MIVADAAPVIAFARIGRLALLREVVEELSVPAAVYDDLVVKGRGKPGADEVAASPWIRQESIRDRNAVGYRLHPERVIRPFLQEVGEAP